MLSRYGKIQQGIQINIIQLLFDIIVNKDAMIAITILNREMKATLESVLPTDKLMVLCAKNQLTNSPCNLTNVLHQHNVSNPIFAEI